MRILFGNRQQKWQGGDIMKMRLFAKSLRKLGHEVTEVCPAEKVDYSKYDIIHAYNVNYPWTRYFMEKARKHKKPFVISTIHFDNNAKLSKSEQKENIKNANKLIMFSSKEQIAIQNFLNIKIPASKSEYLINGVGSKFKDVNSWNKRDISLLMVVNEYHPRKNILRGMELANKMRLNLIIIGKRNPLMSEYNKKCLVSSGKFVRLIQERLSHAQLAHFYNRSKVVLCIGIEDPFPNPIYEATECGCNVVISNTTYSNIDSPNCIYINPRNKPAIESAIIDLIQGKRNRVKFDSYLKQAKELVRIYQNII